MAHSIAVPRNAIATAAARDDGPVRAGATSFRLIWALVIGGLLLYVVFFELTRHVLEAGPEAGVDSTGAGIERRVSRAAPGTSAWAAGVRPGDRILALWTEGWPDTAGETVEVIRVESASTGRDIAVTVDTGQLRLLAFSLVALSLAFLIIGIVVLLLTDGSPAAVALYALCLSGAMALLVAPAALAESRWALTVEWFAISAVEATCPAFFLAMADPERRLSGRARRIRDAFYLAAGLRALAYPPVILWAPEAYSLLRIYSTAVLVASFLASILCAARALRRASSASLRRQNQIVGIGAAIGFFPIILLSLAPFMLSGRYLVRPELAILPLAALPAALGYAILRHHLLGIERLLRRSLLRAGIWLIVVAACGLALGLLRPLEGPWEPSPVAFAVLIFLGVTVIPWLIRQIQTAIDKWLFRDVYDYRGALFDLTSRLAQTRDREELSHGVLRDLARLFNAGSVSVWVHDRSKPPASPTEWPATVVAASGEPEPPGAAFSPAGAAGFPIRLGWAGESIGSLYLGPKRNGEPYLADDLRLVETLAGGLGATVANLQLIDDLRDRVDEIERLYRRLTEAQEEERRRIATDIHDVSIQQVYLLIRRLNESQSPLAIEGVTADLRHIESTLRGVCAALLPPHLTENELGLADAIEWYLIETAKSYPDVPTDFEAGPDVFWQTQALPKAQALALYRVTQEALNNAFKHGAASAITVRLDITEGVLRIEVTDEGPGFDLEEVARRGSRDGHGLGIAGMRERLRTIDGRLQLLSAPGAGTQVIVESDLPGGGRDHERDIWGDD